MGGTPNGQGSQNDEKEKTLPGFGYNVTNCLMLSGLKVTLAQVMFGAQDQEAQGPSGCLGVYLPSCPFSLSLSCSVSLHVHHLHISQNMLPLHSKGIGSFIMSFHAHTEGALTIVSLWDG